MLFLSKWICILNHETLPGCRSTENTYGMEVNDDKFNRISSKVNFSTFVL